MKEMCFLFGLHKKWDVILVTSCMSMMRHSCYAQFISITLGDL